MFLILFYTSTTCSILDVLTKSQIKKGICKISVPSSLPPSTQVSQSFLDSKSSIDLDKIGDNPSQILRVLDVIAYQGGGEHLMRLMTLTTEGQGPGAGEAGHPQPPVCGSAGPALTSPRLIISVHPVPHVTPGAPGPALVCGDQAAPQALTPGRSLHS